MLKAYAQLDFGQSYFKDKAVTELLWEKMPVTLSLGIWSTLLIYVIAIPLASRRLWQHGLVFDRISSFFLRLDLRSRHL